MTRKQQCLSKHYIKACKKLKWKLKQGQGVGWCLDDLHLQG